MISEEVLKSASLVKKKKYFIFNEFTFYTSLDGNYTFDSKNGFELRKGEEVIYSNHLSYTHSKYRNREVTVKNRFLNTYPLELGVGGYNVRVKEPSYDSSVEATYIIEVNNKEVAHLKTNFPFFSLRESYEVHFLSEPEIDVVLFVLMFMYLKLNDSSGT